MAAYTIPAGSIAAHDKLLVATVVDSVTFTDAVQAVEVLSDGAAALYFTVDGSVPSVSGATSFKVPSGSVISTQVRLGSESASLVVKLISAGAPTYSVTNVS